MSERIYSYKQLRGSVSAFAETVSNVFSPSAKRILDAFDNLHDSVESIDCAQLYGTKVAEMIVDDVAAEDGG